MTTDTRAVISTINSIKTLIENFPLTKGQNNAHYSSGIDFIMDVLRNIGITDKDILDFILNDILGVNLNVKGDLGVLTKKIGELSDGDLDSTFLNTLDGILRMCIIAMVNNLLTCDIIPRIPDEAFSGIEIPTLYMDPVNMLSTCPVSDAGRTIYARIESGTTPSQLSDASDLNAKIWYALNIDKTNWKTKESSPKEMFTIEAGDTLQYVKFKLNKDTYQIVDEKGKIKNKRMIKFTNDYLKSIQIINPKTILSYLIQFITTGKPNFNFDFSNIISENTISNIIDGVIESETNDYSVNDCYYDFSNSNWDEMIDEYELYKFNGTRTSDGTVVQVDRQSLYDTINGLTDNGSNRVDNIAAIETYTYNIPFTATTDSTTSYSISLDNLFKMDFVKQIIKNLMQGMIYSIFTPKVMAIILLNMEATGAVNLNGLDLLNFQDLLKGLTRKLYSYLRYIIVTLYREICEKLIKWFTKEIKPLVAAFIAKIAYEQMALYIEILNEAITCISLFGSEGGTVDDVKYADILTTVKNNPQDIMCTT